jgi:drug/metabolite transporter (DMT)-like permease
VVANVGARFSVATPALRRSLTYIIVSGLLGVAGQLLLKRALAAIGPLALRPETVVSLVVALALNPLVVFGLAVYVSGTFFWLLALSALDLSFAYPFASLNYIYVVVASWLILGERPSLVRLIGVAIICLGVWAISRSPARTTTTSPHATADAPPAGILDISRIG